ncbi:MAG: autotransporter outer membrane beta-barrel domain-containing protein [Planctomycetaceae bacterium]|jgi:hypothetical protein|nr:autotransporter outer membrane beta-barrel domain-containing protein [Planctomycetaceae bacterium]
MKTNAKDIIESIKRFVAGWFIIVISTISVSAENYYNVQGLTDNINQINSSGSGNIVINLLFDSDLVTSIPNESVWNFVGSNLSGINISGKSTLTQILQSGTNGRLLAISNSPANVNISNLNLSSFTFIDPNITSGVSRTGGALNITSNSGNYARSATLNNMIFNNNKINVTINYNSPFNASGGGLYMYGGFETTATNLNNNGKNATLNKIDFTNNSVTLIDYPYSTRQNKTATGGGAAILHYDNVNLAEGNVVGNSVSANIKGYVAGGGLYLSRIGNNSAISKFNFTNNSSELQTGGEGIAFAGALFANQEYGGLTNGNLLIPKTTLNISETNFSNNRTINNGVGEALGGAVTLLHDLDGVFNKVIFENNSAQAKSSYAGGGAIAIHSFYQNNIPLTTADLNNIKNQITKFNETIFTNNNAVSVSSSGDGGAIFSTQRIETAKTDFINNIAKGVSASGGAIAITLTHNGAFYDSADTSKIQGGKFTDNQSIASGGESRGGAIYTSKSLEIASSVTHGNVLFEDNRAISNIANLARGNSIFANASVIFNTGIGSKIEDFDGHYITGNVTKTGGGILSLLGETQHQAGSYFIREGVLRSGFTKDGESGFRAIANLYNQNSTGTITFDKGTTWELDLSNADLAKLKSGVRIADGEVIGADEALKLGNSLIDVELVNGTIKLARILDAANLSDIYASAAYIHKWNTIQQATNTRINQLLYRYGTVHGGYISGNRSQVDYRGQSFRVPVAAVAAERNFYNAWVNYVGRKAAAGSSYDAYKGESLDTISNGIQFGFDLASGFGSHFGLMFGYEDSRAEIVNDYIRGDDYYVGVYAAMLFSFGFDIRGTLGFGHQRYKIARYDFGLEREFSIKPDGNTFEFNVEFGRRLQTWHNTSIRPFIGIDYLTNSISSADESLGGFRYSNLSLDQLFFRVGSDVQWHFGLLCFDAGVAFSQQLLDDYAEAMVSQGQISTALRTSRYGNSIFTFNVGANYAFDRFRACSIYINYVGEVFVGGESESINSLQTGIQWKF